jgi:hypothetical protein
MTIAAIIVIIIRLLVPLTILRWRITGAIASMLMDAIDVVLVDVLATAFNEPGGFGDRYQLVDKWLDMYYLAFELYVSLSWSNVLARNTSIFLFVFRLVGLIAFEATHIRKLFFFFPNLFENFFLYFIIAERAAPRYLPTKPWHIALALVLLYIPKVAQEYVLHFAQLHPWGWTKEVIFGIES